MRVIVNKDEIALRWWKDTIGVILMLIISIEMSWERLRWRTYRVARRETPPTPITVVHTLRDVSVNESREKMGILEERDLAMRHLCGQEPVWKSTWSKEVANEPKFGGIRLQWHITRSKHRSIDRLVTGTIEDFNYNNVYWDLYSE